MFPTLRMWSWGLSIFSCSKIPWTFPHQCLQDQAMDEWCQVAAHNYPFLAGLGGPACSRRRASRRALHVIRGKKIPMDTATAIYTWCGSSICFCKLCLWYTYITYHLCIYIYTYIITISSLIISYAIIWYLMFSSWSTWCASKVFWEFLLTGFVEKPVNPQSDENKSLRKYARLMRPFLRTFQSSHAKQSMINHMFLMYWTCSQLWGDYPFEMHSAASELEDLSYGFTNPTFLDVSWCCPQWNDILWFRIHYISSMGNDGTDSTIIISSKSCWGLCRISVVPSGGQPCQWCQGEIWKPWHPKFMLWNILDSRGFSHCFQLGILDSYQPTWGTKSITPEAREAFCWWNRKV